MTSPPTAAQIEEIRKRHEGQRAFYKSCAPNGMAAENYEDRATLLAALDARQQRTPGTVEVCSTCGYGKTYRFIADGPEAEIWATCEDAKCPLLLGESKEGRE